MSESTLAIVNPASAGGATGRHWHSIERQLRAALGRLSVKYTQAPHDAERIAREAVLAGALRLVVAGGDGTASEVVNGLLAADLADSADVAVLPLGTGSDFSRSLDRPGGLEGMIRGLRDGRRRAIDAGRVDYLDRDGKSATSYFLNVCSFGISGLTVELVRRAPKGWGGSVAYALGTVRSIFEYQPRDIEIRVDGSLVHTGPLSMAAAANGRFFGGGMQIAPHAAIDDGLIDLVVVGELSKPRLLANLPSLYRGSHLSHPAVSAVQGRVIEVLADPGVVWLDLDGEAKGTLPATIRVLPGAITIIEPVSTA